MYNNLLAEYINNQIKIPQNEKTNFEIKRSDKINNGIEVILQPYEEIDLLNLYLIIKAYSCNLIYIPHMFITTVKRKDDTFIAHSNHISKFKKMRYIEFIEWFYLQLKNDWKYLDEDNLYSFIFTYPFNIFDRDKIDFIKPIFPWNEEIIQHSFNENIDEYKQRKKIEELTKINRELIKMNKSLLKKINELIK